MRSSTLLLLVIMTVALIELSAARGRGGGGGFRVRVRSSSSRSRSSSSSKSKISKYTPIQATTVRSSVIVRQTTLGSRSNAFPKAVAGYSVYNYVLSSAPVYRSGYPMYNSYVSIPKKRAVRIMYESVKLLDAFGGLCVVGQTSVKQTLREGIDDNLVELKTTVTYKKTGKTTTYDGKTISLDDINEQDFEVTSRARYNAKIVEGTSCQQVLKSIRGTMITMYETNPNGASSLYINKLLLTVIVLFIVNHVFQLLY